MPLLVLAAVMFALFIGICGMVAVAVLSETRGMPGSVWKHRRIRSISEKP